MYRFSFLLLFLSFTTIAAEVSDPQGLLADVDIFISKNLAPVCRDWTSYQMGTCDASCHDGVCSINECIGERDSWGRPMRFNSLNCNDTKFDIWFNPFLGGGGYQILNLKKSNFTTAASAIKESLEIFTQRGRMESCTEPQSKLYPRFAFGKLMITNVQAENFITSRGLNIPVQIVTGSFSAEVDGQYPDCISSVMRTQARFWIGQGVYYTEQILRIDIGTKTVFKIDAVTSENIPF